MNLSPLAILLQAALLLLLRPLLSGFIKNWKAQTPEPPRSASLATVFGLGEIPAQGHVQSRSTPRGFSLHAHVLFVTALCAVLDVPWSPALAPMSLFGGVRPWSA